MDVEKTAEERITKTIEHLKQLNAWSDEVPNEILDGSMGPLEFKVRKNWWHGLYNDLDVLIESGRLPQDIAKDAKDLMVKIKSNEFMDRLTTATDITEANAIIAKILEAEKET
ncbi:MAG: hypothetical protein WC711_02920 [Candidatus Staskawiczbacteria bacterium]|jgi:hypothetical protein